jgi:predicted transport protein
MPLYEISQSNHLSQVKEKDFKLEKEIQELTDCNLKTILGLERVSSQFNIGGFRIDTLAFDLELNSFVIIEYKRDKNFSVIDQGYAYLSLMLNNKADFILEYNEKRKDSIKREDVDWSQTRVVFISPSFTIYQREAINFKDLPIELWEVKRYNNMTVSYTKIQKVSVKESIKTITRQDESIKKVAKEIIVYSEEEHLKIATDEIKELYEKYKQAVLELGDIELAPKAQYIAFIGTSNITDVVIQKSSLNIYINLKKGELDDPKHLTEDISKKGHWGNGNYRIKLQNDEELDYVISLVKQSLKKNKK